MSKILKGITQNAQKQGLLKLKSITLTASDSTASVLNLFRYGLVAGEVEQKVKALEGTTVQVVFDNVEYPDGLTVVPDANCDLYVIEYE